MPPGPEKDGRDGMVKFVENFKQALRSAGFDDFTINAIVAASLNTVAEYVIDEIKQSTAKWEEAIKHLKHKRH